MAASEPDLQRLFDAQSCLELRLSRFLSLGRWLWHGQMPGPEVRFRENSGVVAPSEAVAMRGRTAMDVRGGGLAGPISGGPNNSGSGIWVPWEAEVANASPGFLKVSG